MRDHYIQLEDGSVVPVARAPESVIQACLCDGIRAVWLTGNDQVADLAERCKLELEIRAMGMGEVD